MRILVTFAQGYGNLIMATPLLRALHGLGHTLDALVRCPAADAKELLAGHPSLRHVATQTCGLPLVPTRYSCVIRTVWDQTPLGHRQELHPDPAALAHRHEADVNLDAARALGWADETPQPFVARPVSAAPPDSTVRGVRILLLDPAPRGTAWDRRRYPHMTEVARRLIERGAQVILLGSATDARRWDRYPAGVKKHTPRSIGEAAAGLARADAVIGSDCGPVHIAAALGTPTLALFGPTSEIKNRPLGPRARWIAAAADCRPCQMTPRWDACAEAWCLRALDPRRVVDEAWSMIAGREAEDTAEGRMAGILHP